jgi:hypothetical protein
VEGFPLHPGVKAVDAVEELSLVFVFMGDSYIFHRITKIEVIHSADDT